MKRLAIDMMVGALGMGVIFALYTQVWVRVQQHDAMWTFMSQPRPAQAAPAAQPTPTAKESKK